MTLARQKLAQFQVAMMLLTRLPACKLTAPIPALQDAAWAYPLAGLVVGAVGAAALTIALWIGAAPGIAAGLALIAKVLATGALHEDGLADVADGFGGGQTRVRKLEIMRDSRIGSYGTLALILSVGMRWQAIALVAGINAPVAVCAIVATAIISRAGLPAMMVALPPAREGGLGHSAAGGDWTGAGMSAALGGVAVMVLLGPVAGVAVALAVAGALLGLGLLAIRQIGGQTGDVLGTGQQIAEITAWVVLLALVKV